MPPLEIFGRLDARRSNSETISPELPTRADLQAWVAERDKMEEETDFFDIKEIEKLQEFSKGPSLPHFPPDPGIVTLIFAMIFSRCSKEPISRRNRPN